MITKKIRLQYNYIILQNPEKNIYRFSTILFYTLKNNNASENTTIPYSSIKKTHE